MVLVGLFLGYPYVKKYTSNNVQDKINNAETAGAFVKKFVRQISNQKSKDKPNDNPKN